MKKSFLLYGVLIVLGMLILTACPPQAVLTNFKISFTIIGETAAGIVSGNITGIQLSLVNENSAPVLAAAEFGTTAQSGSYQTADISFEGANGYYTITGFSILDKNGKIAGIIPRAGTVKGSTVKNALPYRVQLLDGKVITLETAAVASSMNAADFGYSVNITAPAASSEVSGQVTVQAEVYDDYSITRVEFYTDGVLATTDTEAPYTYAWDTTKSTNSEHTLMVKAYDSLGLVITDNDTRVTVRNLLGLTRMPIAAGNSFSSVVITGGSSEGMVYAWGVNGSYQLGNGDASTRAYPTEVSGLSNVAALASGYSHTLALKGSGSVWAWGLNSSGQLGDNSTTSKSTPVDIGLSHITAVACGSAHSLVLCSDGTVIGFGENNNGELGMGNTTSPVTKPTPIPGLVNIVAIACGADYSMVLKDNGTVWTTGYNDSGRLGDGTTTQRTSFVQVKDYKDQYLDRVTAIACGAHHSHAVRSDGTVWSWGYNANGELGDAGTNVSSKAVKVNGIINVRAVAAGDNHVLALKTDGTVWTWGYNNYGELGDGTTYNKYAPVKVEGLSNIIYIAASKNCHSMAVDSSGNIFTWGYNNTYQLGDGTTTNRSTPFPVNNLKACTESIPIQPGTSCAPQRNNTVLAAGGFHSIMINPHDPNKGLLAWGTNGYGELGDNTTVNKTSPVSALNINNVVSIAAGGRHSLALSDDGKVYACGLNNWGQLGDGTTTNRSLFQKVQTIPGDQFVVIAAGGQYNGSSHGYVGHNLALKTDGTVWAWGYNNYGQLGDGSVTYRTYPVKVNGLDHVAKIACSSLSSYALKEDGTVWSWGYNAHGELGDNTTLNKFTPVKVESLSGTFITDLAPGSWHILARDTSGNIYAWGYNAQGQLGDGSTTNSLIPKQVPSQIKFKKIACGPEHSFAVTNDNALYAWGYNGYGNLGDGTTNNKPTPTWIMALSNISEIAASRGYDGTSIYSHSLAITTDGQVWGWGYNGNGELGDSTTTTPRTSPVKVKVPWYIP